jgi:2-methylaconitate cis-trans-isomerase PrpF
VRFLCSVALARRFFFISAISHRQYDQPIVGAGIRYSLLRWAAPIPTADNSTTWGAGSPIALRFLDPGGAASGKLLATGRVRDVLSLPDGVAIEVSMVDASNPGVFGNAQSFGLTGTESPDTLSANHLAMERFEALRTAAAVGMGLVSYAEETWTKLRNLPLGSLIARAQNVTLRSGRFWPSRRWMS